MAVNKCVKYLLFIFNLLFWISGCVILGVGIYLKVTNNSNTVIKDNLPSFELLIAIGAIIMVLGFLGCCGAYRENRCLLLLFFVFLLVIFILLLAAGILGALGQNTVSDWVKNELDKLRPISDQPQNVRQDIENMQRQLQCCGLFDGPSDWKAVPDSCRCNATSTTGSTGSSKNTCSSGIYQTPCYDKIISLMKSHMTIALGIAFGVAVLLLFGMVFSMMLFCQIGKKDGPTTA